MRVNNVLLGGPSVELRISPWCVIKGDHLDIDGFRDLDLIVQDGVHQVVVVLHHRALAGRHRLGEGPAESNTDLEVSYLGVQLGLIGINWGKLGLVGDFLPGPQGRLLRDPPSHRDLVRETQSEWERDARKGCFEVKRQPEAVAEGGVLDSPGMPILPPSLTMLIQSFKTWAGTSPLEPSAPVPRASNPTQSTAPSTFPSERGPRT